MLDTFQVAMALMPLDIQGSLTQLQTLLLTISTTIAVIALICLGIVAMLKFNKTGSFREVLSGLGTVFIGVFLAAAAVALVTVFQGIATSTVK